MLPACWIPADERPVIDDRLPGRVRLGIAQAGRVPAPVRLDEDEQLAAVVRRIRQRQPEAGGRPGCQDAFDELAAIHGIPPRSTDTCSRTGGVRAPRPRCAPRGRDRPGRFRSSSAHAVLGRCAASSPLVVSPGDRLHYPFEIAQRRLCCTSLSPKRLPSVVALAFPNLAEEPIGLVDVGRVRLPASPRRALRAARPASP